MFGEVVRQHRRRLGLSQEDLAERTGVAVRSISKLETGRISVPRPVTVRLLADAFALSGPEREEFCEAAAAPPEESAEAPALPARPAQLPADVDGFIGRAGPLGQLDALLELGGDRPSAVVITAIAGTAGVGKTTLAIRWGHQVRHRFPDGQLYVNLRGFDPAGTVMQPSEALRRFLDALEVPQRRVPADLEARSALLRTELAGRRMLIVLDNARDAEQVRPLLPGVPGCLVLITSRHRLTSLVAADSAHPITLDMLTVEESRRLLTWRLGEARVAAEPEAVGQIISYSAQLPLALAIVAARAAGQPNFPLASFAAELHDSRDRLDALAAGEDPTTDVRAVFSWSYRALSPGAARLFRLLGVHPGPDISTAAAASLAGVPIRQARRLVTELAAAHLISEHAPGRHSFHDLLRAYAAEQASLREPAPKRLETLHRLLDHYLRSAYAAAMLLNPARDPLTLPPALPGVSPEQPTGHRAAMEWFAAEYAVLRPAIQRAAAAGLDLYVCQLTWCLVHFVDRRGHWGDWAALQREALAAAQRLEDPELQAGAHRFLALALIKLDRHTEADEQLSSARQLYEASGDRVGLGYTLIHLGLSRVRRGEDQTVLADTQQALELFQAAGHRAGQALAWNGIGWLQATSEPEQAVRSCRTALALYREIGGNGDAEAATWDSLGYAYSRLGDLTQARECYLRAVDLVRELGDRHSEAGTLTRLGEALAEGGDLPGAQAVWRDALALLDILAHPDAGRLRERIAG